MHLAIIASLLLLPTSQNYNTYGKTEADILAMGQDKWEQFYTSKAGGESTLTMCDSANIYGVVLRHRNDFRETLENNLNFVTAEQKLRPIMAQYAGHCIDLASNLSGGGTIWNLYYAGISADVENAVYGILGAPDAETVKPMVVSQVSAQIEKSRKAVEASHADKTATYFKYGDARKTLKEIHSDLRSILLTTKPLPRIDSDRVLNFCEKYAELITEQFGH